MAPQAPHQECPMCGQRGHTPERCWTLAPCTPATYIAPTFPCNTYPPSATVGFRRLRFVRWQYWEHDRVEA